MDPKVKILRVLTTSACNHRCAFCHNEGQTSSKRHDLHPVDFQRVLNYVVPKGIKQLQFSGGEPILNPYFEQLVQIASEASSEIGIGMATNGTLLNPSLVRNFSRTMNNIRINLPTLDPVHYKKIKGSSDLQRVINTIDLLVLEGAHTGINVVSFGQAEEEIIDLLEFVAERKMDIKFLEWIPFSQGEPGSSSNLFTILENLAASNGRFSESVRWYEIPTKRGIAKVRIVESFCNSKNISACKEYAEVRLLPNLQFQPCLLSDHKNLTFDIQDQQSIECAFLLATQYLGCCPVV